MRRVTPFDSSGYYYYYGAGRRPRVWNVVDRDALAIINAFTTPPTAARAALISSTVSSLKSSGVWPLLDVLYMLAAADSQAALINWKNPGTFDATAVNSPTFVADRGFTGNGTTSRLNTGWNPVANGVNFIQDNASVWAWSLTANINGGALAGNNSGTANIGPRHDNTSLSGHINDATGTVFGAAGTSVGLLGISRPNASTKRGFKDGAQIGADASVASTGLHNDVQWVCAGNSTSFSTKQIALAAFGADLGGREDEFYAVGLAYMQAVGAA